jgi:gamma-glutamylputrescine oxidase
MSAVHTTDSDPNYPPSHWLEGINPEVFSVVAIPQQTEVVVIGGGLMGVSTAYWLAKLGIEVLLLESRWISWGATGRNAGLMLAGSSPLEEPKLVEEVLSAENIEADYFEPGHLALASSIDIWSKICDEVTQRKNSLIPLYALEHSVCEDLLGMRISQKFLGGRWFPKGRVIHSAKFAYGLAISATRHNASIVTQTPVLQVAPVKGKEQWVVHTLRASIQTKHVVYACNAQICEFLPKLKSIITPIRGQVICTEPLPPMFKVGLAVDWGTVYWRQTIDGAIVLGGYRNQDPETEISTQESINPRIHDALDLFLPEAFPEFPDFRVHSRWAGIMDCTKDGKPLVGLLPNLPNQWVIAGFCGHGMPAALGVGKAVAEAIATEEISSTLQQFNPNRFEKDVFIC